MRLALAESLSTVPSSAWAMGRDIATPGNDAVASLVRARETGVAVPVRA